MQINKILIVLAMFFFLTTIAGVCYIVSENFLTNNLSTNQTEEVSNNQNEEELDIDSMLVEYLYSKVVLNGESYVKYFMYEDNDNYIVSEASEESKLTLAYNNLKSKDFAYVSTDTLEETMVIPGYTYSDYSLGYHTLDTENGYTTFFSYDSLLLAYKDLFGEDETFDKDEIIKTDAYMIKYYVYNEELDGYVPYVTEGGGTSSSYFSGKISKAIKSNNKILIYENVEEISLDSNTNVSNPTVYIYTFNIDDDGMYSFISRVKAS